MKLADILGHSSIETTRIYLLTTGTEHLRRLERLGLLLLDKITLFVNIRPLTRAAGRPRNQTNQGGSASH